MSEHNYQLQKYKGPATRFICPSCENREKSFSLYIDADSKPLSPLVGKCNREVKCGYHYTPKQYFEDNNIEKPTFTLTPKHTPRPQPKLTINYIPEDPFLKSLMSNHTIEQIASQNTFVKFLSLKFGNDITKQLVDVYKIGTSKHIFRWSDHPGYISPSGSTIFWQVDINGNIRDGKIMLYNPSGKRIKEPRSHIDWSHRLLKIEGTKQCLFGEHLIKDRTKKIGIVESEKTAIIASAYLPQFIWVACGSLSQLTFDRCQVLKGRKIVLVPDLNGFEKWKTKSEELKSSMPGTSFLVSDLLQKNCTLEEIEKGYDIADYLLQFDLKDFNVVQPTFDNTTSMVISPPRKPQTKVKNVPDTNSISSPSKATFNYPDDGFHYWNKTQAEDWTNQIKSLQSFFKNTVITQSNIKINAASTITDVRAFIDSHLQTVKFNNGNATFKPYLQRLISLQNFLNTI